MTNSPNLYIHEELVLLALRDQEGTFISGPQCHHAIGGAILSELLIADRIAFEADGERVKSIDPTPMGEPILDECLAELGEARRLRAAETWIANWANEDRLAHRVAEGLCRRGILRADERKVLLIFSRSGPGSTSG